LLLLGDSFAAGDGVDNDERFSDRLERALPGLEVMNCGLPGSGTDQQLLLFRRYRQRYEYDALLLCPLVENIRRNVTRYRFPASSALDESVVVRKPFFVVTERGLELRGVPVSAEPVRLSQLSEEELAHVDFGGERRSTGMRILINRYAAAIKPWLIRLLRFQPFPEYGDPASPGWQLMRALLETIIRENGDRPTILAPLPTYIHVEHPQTENYMARFLELANDRVHVVDLLPHFLRLSPRERRRYRFPRDPHYTALGHAVIATALEQEIRQLGLIST
jgi:hypothetical protein